MYCLCFFGSVCFAISPDGVGTDLGAPSYRDSGHSTVGALFVFVKEQNGTWKYRTKITDGTNRLVLNDLDYFGSAAALSPDGNILFVTAKRYASSAYPGYDAGAVHIFTKRRGAWTHRAKIAHDVNGADLSGFAEFGSSVAASSDGNTLFVGTSYDKVSARHYGSGNVHVFTKDSDTV